MIRNGAPCLDLSDEHLDTFVKLVVILYADDAVIFAKTEQNLVEALNVFSKYCERWKLQVNFEKSKVLVFGDRASNNRKVSIGNYTIETVREFNYLGVIFCRSRSFAAAKKYAIQQAMKAMFSLFQKIRNLNLSVECQLKLVDTMVVPVLLYSCEVWGFGDLTDIEKDFMKYSLHVKKNMPNVMLYGDLGRFPLSVIVKKRVIGYWFDLLTGDKLSAVL